MVNQSVEALQTQESKIMHKNKLHGFIHYTIFLIFASLLTMAGSGCSTKPVKLPKVDATLAETIIVTRNGWDRDILPSSSAETKEFISKKLEECVPVRAYKSWDDIDVNTCGSPNTVTLLFPDDSEIALQYFLIGSYLSIIDQAGETYLYLVDDAWLTTFIETVTEMVEQDPDKRYVEETQPLAAYEFNVMTDDNVPIGCEFGTDRTRQMDSLEMLAELEKLQGFVFPDHSEVTLRFFFSQEPEDVYVRLISADNWQDEYICENHRIKVPDELGIYNFFVDIRWDSENTETVFFSVTVQNGTSNIKESPDSSEAQPQAEQPAYIVAADPSIYEITATSISVKIINLSAVEGGYGYAYRIERKMNGGWEIVPLEFDVQAIAAILPAKQANTETFSLHHEQYDYTPGTYRIVLLDGLGGASAEFALLSASERKETPIDNDTARSALSEDLSRYLTDIHPEYEVLNIQVNNHGIYDRIYVTLNPIGYEESQALVKEVSSKFSGKYPNFLNIDEIYVISGEEEVMIVID